MSQNDFLSHNLDLFRVLRYKLRILTNSEFLTIETFYISQFCFCPLNSDFASCSSVFSSSTEKSTVFIHFHVLL